MSLRIRVNRTDSRRRNGMSTDPAFRLLRQVGPRSDADFDEWIDSLDGLRTRITSTPVPVRQRPSRIPIRERRTVGLSLAAGAVAAAVAVAVGLATTAASPPSAYAAAKKALAATAAANSGTISITFSHNGSSYVGDTTRWNGDSISVTRGQQSHLDAFQELVLTNGGAYVERTDGTWLHYASPSGVGAKVGPMVELAQNNVEGNSASQVLSVASDLTSTTEPDGSTTYAGTIPNTPGDPGVDPNDGTILRMIANLSDGAYNEPGSPGGYHNGLQFTMPVDADGLVRQISVSYKQLGTGSAQSDGSYTQTVSYSQLGSTPPITPPTDSTLTPPVIWSPRPACPPPPHRPCGG
jgi:hypothetical protein